MKHTLLTLILIFGLVVSSRATDLFEITTNIGLQESNRSALDLVENVVKAKGNFALLGNTAYVAHLRYGNVLNAINLDLNATGTSVVLTIPSTGFKRTFTGATRDDVETQIKDFLKKDGSDEVAKFSKEMARQSVISLSDGNPSSTTATSANAAYRAFALRPTLRRQDDSIEDNKDNPWKTSLNVQGGTIDTRGFTGSTAIVTAGAGIDFSRNVGLQTLLTAKYIDLEGSRMGMVIPQLGLPITILNRGDNNKWELRLTPYVGGSGHVTVDGVAGGLLIEGGLAASTSYQVGPVILGLADQLSLYKSYKLSIGSIKIDPNIEQKVVKNGLFVVYPYKSWFIQGAVSYTNFLNDAYVKNYATADFALGYRLKSLSDISLSYTEDIGDKNYTARYLTLESVLRF